MRSIHSLGILLGGAMLLGAAGTAQAQDTVRANVPFAFVVNGQEMPAGHYLIQRDDLSPSMLLIRGDERHNHAAAFVLTNRDGGQDAAGSRAALTFQRYENTYRLSSVWDSQDEGFDLVTR